MKKRIVRGVAVIGVALLMIFGDALSIKIATAQGQRPVLPIFEVDPRFPKMPDNLMLGGVGGVDADAEGNVWVINRPHTLGDGNPLDNGFQPAPAVVAFDPNGNYIRGWGGPSKSGEYQWPNRGGLHSSYAECAACSQERRTNGDGRPGSGEHGIAVDH